MSRTTKNQNVVAKADPLAVARAALEDDLRIREAKAYQELQDWIARNHAELVVPLTVRSDSGEMSISYVALPLVVRLLS